VVKELRTLGDVRSQSIKAEDVTRQMVDLEARLRNLRREEEVVAELFRRQGRIADVLEVERELSRVRGEIEQGESALAGLRDSVAYSTITITIQTRPSKVEQKLREWSAGYHVLNAWHALVKVVRALITALIYIAIVIGPFVVVALVIWWAIRASRRAKTPPHTDV
jgi:multisubunit Na+/H+ antiporter MnhC subunit